MKSKKLFNVSRKLFPGGVNSPVRFYDPYPLFIKKGKGSKIFDVDGNKFIDFCLAYGPLILGHSDASVKNAVKKQLENGWLFGAPTEEEILLAKIINESIPYMEMMRFVSSGTEATMHAIRLARAYTNRKKIVKVFGGFHGSHDSVLVSPGSGAIGIPSSPGIPDEISANTLVVDYNNTEEIKKVFENNKDEIAAIIIEPVLGNVGVIPPLDGYLKMIREITTDNNSLLIFDEVITGFRFHYGSAGQYFDVEPDLTILGKIVGGGFPLAVFGGKEDIMKNISPSGNVYQAGTFSGNPISMVAGIATLKKLKNKDYKNLENRVSIINKYVEDAKNDKKIDLQLNSMVSMFQIFFNKNEIKNYNDALKSNTANFKKFFNKLLDRGFYIPPSQFESLFISFSHTKKEVEDFGRIIYEGL
ncbi:MAG: glutamate-1-semialdehyde 2,1-aminomutase [Thermoplasmata archaeon]|nr:glutamate-1-semialdehyde 2,1-aminomutase [Thermoplasmata archaeon]